MGTDGWTFHVEEPDGWLLVPTSDVFAPDTLAEWERLAADLIVASFDAPVPDGVGPDGVSPAGAVPGGAVPDGAVPDAAADSAAGAAAAAVYDEAVAGLRRQVATESVSNLRAFADGVIEAGAVVVATIRVPESTPAPVLVTVGVEPPGDPGDHLLEALGATGGSAVAPPKIEHLDLPDGDGMRVTRLDLDPATGAARISICLGRRTEHPDAVVDTVLQWRSQELLHGPAMTELLDDLLPAVRITRSTP